jgi:hypothetical protein
MKIGWRITKEHIFIQMKYENFLLSKWKQRHFKQHHGTKYAPFHRNTKKDVCQFNL